MNATLYLARNRTGIIFV